MFMKTVFIKEELEMEEFKVSDLPEIVAEKYDDIAKEVVEAISNVMTTILYKS